MSRATLAARRQNETVNVDHKGHRFSVTVGYDQEGAPMEVFADSARIGTDMAHTIADACVVISLALQYGCPAADLPKSIGRVPDAMDPDGFHAASVLGVIIDVVSGFRAPWVIANDA